MARKTTERKVAATAAARTEQTRRRELDFYARPLRSKDLLICQAIMLACTPSPVGYSKYCRALYLLAAILQRGQYVVCIGASIASTFEAAEMAVPCVLPLMQDIPP